MFHKFHNLTLQRKQMLIIMLISTVALLLACVAFVTYDSFSYRRELVAKTASLAEVVGINTTAAIDFNDPTAAGQTLAALRAEPNIMVAHLYKTDGERFATYTRAGAPPLEELPLVSGSRQEFTKDYLWLVRPIIQGGETVGTIELIADLGEFRRRLWSYGGIVAIVFGGALVVALILSLQLGQIISRPVQHLAKVVQSVAHDKNYSVRATKQNEDELGQLIDGFNEMLAQIQQRDGALQTARDNLEFRVAERTKELDSSLSLLNATLDSTTDGILTTQLSGSITCTNMQFRLMWGIRRELLDRQPEMIAFIAAQTTDPEQYQARVTAIFAQPDLEAFDILLLKDGRTFERYVKPQRIEGRTVGLVINFRDVTARKQAEAELRWKSAFLEAQAASSIDGMLVVSDAGQKIFQNQRLVELWQIPTEIGTNPDDAKQIQFVASRTRDPEKFVERITYLQAHPNEVSHDEIELVDGTILDRHTYPVVGPDGTRYGRIWAFRDITERKQGEIELAKAHKEIVATSRQAGMAEVATGVLHNVGNVLNSVNVASTCIADNLRKSKAVNLTKVVGLLRDHEADLGQFLSADPKGKQIPGYLDQLAQHLALEQTNALKELTELQKHIDHIKDIVTMQQSFAKVSGLTESVNVIDLIEDALRMNESALARHDIKVIKEFAALPPVTVDKHKVLQILVNLVCNAKQACDAANRDDKRMTLRVLSAADHVQIAVADNGVGIPPENLTRIFNHGFTTKKNGHGFGLHSGALAAKEMGGALRVQSDGVGCGTVFTLELPLNPTKQNHA